MEKLSPDSRKINFNISENELIEFLLLCDIDDMNNCEDIEIFYINQGNRYQISNDCFSYSLGQFKDLLDKVLNNKLKLHKSINHDIGYLWNEYLQNKQGHNFIQQKIYKDVNDHDWVGEKYLLWESPKKYTTWLYNKNESIYFEVAPSYKWHFVDPKKGENFVAYEEWIKSYEPIAIIELKRAVAQELLKRTEELMVLINEYDKKNLIVESEKD